MVSTVTNPPAIAFYEYLSERKRKTRGKDLRIQMTQSVSRGSLNLNQSPFYGGFVYLYFSSLNGPVEGPKA